MYYLIAKIMAGCARQIGRHQMGEYHQPRHFKNTVLMEYARIVITSTKDTLFEQLEDREVLAALEFSKFNGKIVLFSAKIISVPEQFKQYAGRSIHPRHVLIT